MGKNVVALGELLIDFTDNGISPQDKAWISDSLYWKGRR